MTIPPCWNALFFSAVPMGDVGWLVWTSSRTSWPLINLAVNRLASLAKYATGFRGSLSFGVSTLTQRGTCTTKGDFNVEEIGESARSTLFVVRNDF
jgi:hypothetical protein